MALFSKKPAASMDSRVKALEDGQKTLLEQNTKILALLQSDEEPEGEPPTAKKKAKAKAKAEDTEDDAEQEGDEDEAEQEGDEGDAEQADPDTEEAEGDEDEAEQAAPKAKKTSQAAPNLGAVMRELKSLRKQIAGNTQRQEAGELASQIGLKKPLQRGGQNGQQTMKRSEWQTLAPRAQADFFKSGGKLTD